GRSEPSRRPTSLGAHREAPGIRRHAGLHEGPGRRLRAHFRAGSVSDGHSAPPLTLRDRDSSRLLAASVLDARPKRLKFERRIVVGVVALLAEFVHILDDSLLVRRESVEALLQFFRAREQGILDVLTLGVRLPRAESRIKRGVVLIRHVQTTRAVTTL